MENKTPVIVGLEPYEIIFGSSQPEYALLHALRGPMPHYEVMSRWEPTPDERQMISNGADVFVSIWTFGGPYPPTLVRVFNKKDCAEYIKAEMQLDRALNDRLRR